MGPVSNLNGGIGLNNYMTNISSCPGSQSFLNNLNFAHQVPDIQAMNRNSFSTRTGINRRQ